MEDAIKHLKKDKYLRKVIVEFETTVLKKKGDYFSALVRSIIYQQLSGKAASSILNKFILLFPKKIPKETLVLKLKDEEFKSSGVSGQKMNYLRDLALKFTDGTIDSKKINKQSDEEVIEHLVAVKGIGKWTAQMFLMFTLNRMDVMPTGDLGIQKGFKEIFNLRKLPDEKKMLKLSKSWRPYRTVASMYLWKVADKSKK